MVQLLEVSQGLLSLWRGLYELKRWKEIVKVLLAEGCNKFASNFLDISNVHVFAECLTAASASMKTFRRNFVQENTIALDQPRKLIMRKHRAFACRYLSYRASRDGVRIRHAWSKEGEYQVKNDLLRSLQIPDTPYFADGYMKENGQRKVIDVANCYVHQHSCQFDKLSSVRGICAKEIRKRDQRRTAKLEELGYVVETVYDCQIKKELKDSAEMRTFFEKSKIPVIVSFCTNCF